MSGTQMELQRKKRSIFYSCAPKPAKLPLLDYKNGILDLAYSELSCSCRTRKWIQNNYLPGDVSLLTCHQKFCLGSTGQLLVPHSLLVHTTLWLRKKFLDKRSTHGKTQEGDNLAKPNLASASKLMSELALSLLCCRNVWHVAINMTALKKKKLFMAGCFSSLVKVKWIIFAICSPVLNLLSKPDRNLGYPRKVHFILQFGEATNAAILAFISYLH